MFAPWVVVTSMVPETSARPSESEFIKGLEYTTGIGHHHEILSPTITHLRYTEVPRISVRKI